jgi:hypothetical protein
MPFFKWHSSARTTEYIVDSRAHMNLAQQEGFEMEGSIIFGRRRFQRSSFADTLASSTFLEKNVNPL